MLSLQFLGLVASGGLVLIVLQGVTSGIALFRRNAAAMSHIPGYRIFLHPHVLFAAFLPRWAPHFNLGMQYSWHYKHALFERYKCDIVSIVSFVPFTKSIVVADPEAIKYIVSERKKFVKPLGMYKPLAMFGPNVGVTEGSEWTRHRRIVASSNLLENINQLAFENTMKTLGLCFEDWEDRMSKRGERQVSVDNVVQLTLKLALFVILGAGFSHLPDWDDDSAAGRPSHHQMSFRHALHGVLENVHYRIFLPSLAYRIPFWRFPKHVDLSFTEFGDYLVEMIKERHESGSASSTDLDIAAGKRKRVDLLGALIQSSEATATEASGNGGEEDAAKEKKGFAPLTDTEVAGNIYIFLLAGHDTTAHTLAFTFGLLALYPSIQHELYTAILTVLPELSEELTYSHIPALTYSLAVFMETLRLYPSVVHIPKYSVEDTIVPVRSFSLDGGKTGNTQGIKKIQVPRQSDVLLSVTGLHYNKLYWGEDAHAFRPSRFIDRDAPPQADGIEEAGEKSYRWPREAFMGFSAGARSCLGQKFAQVEAVTIITEIIRRYEVVLAPEALKGESADDARKRLLDGCTTVITLTPTPLPVIFKERTSA